MKGKNRMQNRRSSPHPRSARHRGAGCSDRTIRRLALKTVLALAASGVFSSVPLPVLAAAGDAAFCPTTSPLLPEVAVVELPTRPPPIARVPLQMEASAGGEPRLLNVFAAPTFVEPEFRAVLEADSAALAAMPSCWRVSRLVVRLEVTAARLEIPREFAGNDCLDRGALAGARAFYTGTVAGMRQFFERAQPAIVRYSAAFGWTQAEDEGAAFAAFNIWLRPRLPELWEAAKAEVGGELRLPTQAVGLDAAQHACPDFIEELRRFRTQEAERRDLGRRL